MHDVLKDMQKDLETRDLRPNTVTAYLRYARKFVREIGKPLGEVDRDDVRQYLLTLRARGLRPPTRNMALAAVHFLFCTTLRRPQVVAGIRRALTPAVLRELRAYYRARRPRGPYLFPGRGTGRPITRVAVAKALAVVSAELGLRKRVHPHLLRHAFAVHLLELGTDLRTVQMLLGHRCLSSTARYLYLRRAQLARAPSPIDLIGSPRARILD